MRQKAWVRRIHPGAILAFEHEQPFVDAWIREHSEADPPLVLDAGCGFQYGLTSCYRGRLRVVGLDHDPVLLLKNVDVETKIIGDVEILPFASNTFDLVFCRDVIEHLPHPDLAVQGFARVLKHGGALVITTVSVENPAMWLTRWVPRWARTLIRSASFGPELGENASTFYRANTPARLRFLLEGSGFSTEREIHWPTFIWYFRFWTPALLTLAVLNKGLEKCGLSRLFGGLIYCASKQR